MINPVKSSIVFGVSTIGPLHLEHNLPNQDAFAHEQFEWGNVAVVSDGLGSKKYSDIGAKYACDAVISAALSFHGESVISHKVLTQRILQNWLGLLKDYDANDCATTCLFVIQHYGNVIMGQLGDGLIAALGQDVFCYLAEDKEDSFSNITECLHEKVEFSSWRFTEFKLSDFNQFLICTDGISDDLPPESYQGFCQDFIESYLPMDATSRDQQITDILTNWPVKGHTDDKTILVLSISD